MLPLPFEKVRQTWKKIALAKTGDRANSISDLDKTVFDARRNILSWFTRLRGDTCNRPRAISIAAENFAAIDFLSSRRSREIEASRGSLCRWSESLHFALKRGAMPLCRRRDLFVHIIDRIRAVSEVRGDIFGTCSISANKSRYCRSK